ncbi:MAG: RidA family protein [Gammaproteobacteria bacterium]|nr:RidA family protein [Gammaproteobacteria bacterium]
MRKEIQTSNAPAAIGTYSQAIKSGQTVYLSGQIPLDPVTMNLIEGDVKAQVIRVFENLKAVAEAAGGSLQHIVKLTVFILDFANFPIINEVMQSYFQKPFPARTTLGVAALPKNALVEIDAIMILGD